MTTREQGNHDRFALVIEAAPDPSGAPVLVRLRRLLKTALRCCGLRCVSITTEAGEKGKVKDEQ